MNLSVRFITIDCADPYALAEFWSRAFGVEMNPDDLPGDGEASLMIGAGEPELLFVEVPEGKEAKNRVHLDLEPDEPRDEAVARLLELGATEIGDYRRDDGSGWWVLADPEGNEFCVLVSAAERAELD
ncbi:MAG: glyoxalase [Actinomycetia bacterium]|nr:glyoxalase [Actinomycetes bacterium]